MRKNESEEKKISLSYILIRALIVLAALIVAFLLNRFLLEKEAEQKSSGRGFVYDPMVPEDNKTLVDFKAAYPDRRVVMAC